MRTAGNSKRIPAAPRAVDGGQWASDVLAHDGFVKLQFLGATGTVTGSKYLVTGVAGSLLVDCGLFQGYKALRLRNWAALPLAPRALGAVVLTHAHLDHSGYIPVLVRSGFSGRIYCSEATYEVCRILLPDSGTLQEEEAARANRNGYSKHKPALPLYTREDAEDALRYFAPVAFGKDWLAMHGVTARLSRAGHILGAASVTLESGNRRIVFSGDIGRPHDPILCAPEPAARADLLVMESTYGSRTHDPADPAIALGEVVNETVAKGGVVVVPAFAVGRTQSLLFHLQRLKAEGVIPHGLPVYLDSPMAADVTRIYRSHRDEHRLTLPQCEAMCRVARVVNDWQESQALAERHRPMVVIAGSGMATGGRVLNHLKHFAPDARNTILFTGFQAGGTRGASLVGGAAQVRIHGNDVPVHARVVNFDNLSAHADRGELLDWLAASGSHPGRIFLTHGEPDSADALRRAIRDRFGWDAEIPDYLESVEVKAAEPAPSRTRNLHLLPTS